jgi:hypothetical protein
MKIKMEDIHKPLTKKLSVEEKIKISNIYLHKTNIATEEEKNERTRQSKLRYYYRNREKIKEKYQEKKLKLQEVTKEDKSIEIKDMSIIYQDKIPLYNKKETIEISNLSSIYKKEPIKISNISSFI